MDKDTKSEYSKIVNLEDGDAQELGEKSVCSWLYRWVVLLFIMFLTFGSYWVFDTPGALFTQLQGWFGSDYTSSKNLTLYSVYSYPNIILCFFGGIIVDRFTGVRLGAVLFCGFILTGEILFAIGVQVQQYYLCLVGRFVFGLGGESLTVAQNTYTARWFDGPQLALAFGLVLSFARVGSSVNFAATPSLATISVPFAVWFGAGTCFISFTACCILGLLDKAGEKWVVKTNVSTEKISFRHITRFPGSTYIIYFICVFFYIGILTFYTVASDIMQHTGVQYSETTATLFLSIPNFVSIIASPLFGFCIDKFGRALYWMTVACIMLIVAHLCFLGNAYELFEIHPVVIMLWLGVGYAMFAAAIWPMLAFLVAPNMLGTAYGAMTAVQNAGLAIFPQIIGVLQDADGISDSNLKYSIPIMIFVCCAVLALGLTLLLMSLDAAGKGNGGQKGKLNADAALRKRYKEMMSAVDAAEPAPLIEPYGDSI
ncbi:MFS domain-containing protein [Balamuthia mandrillaris]